MRNPINPNERDFSKYDNMTTKQLDDILTAYFLFPDETQDIELVSHILEVITERDIKKISENIPVPSWSKFLEDHAFVTGQPLSSPEENIAPDPPADIHRAKKNPFFRYIGSLSAILVCVLLIGTVTAYAAKIDLFSAVVQWTQETFSFNLNDNESPPEQIAPQLESFCQQVNQSDVSPLFPTYLPDGYIIEDENCFSNPAMEEISCLLSDGSDTIIIIYTIHKTSEVSIEYEKSDAAPEKIELEGTTAYLFSNLEYYTAVWLDNNVEGSITMKSKDELIKIIKSLR